MQLTLKCPMHRLLQAIKRKLSYTKVLESCKYQATMNLFCRLSSAFHWKYHFNLQHPQSLKSCLCRCKSWIKSHQTNMECPSKFQQVIAPSCGKLFWWLFWSSGVHMMVSHSYQYTHRNIEPTFQHTLCSWFASPLLCFVNNNSCCLFST